jgi:hypothetical protein
MNRSDIEESNAKCHICGGGLLYPEHATYGNRCVFCADKPRQINLLTFLVHAYYDCRIYNILVDISKKQRRVTDEWGIESKPGRSVILAILGSVGAIDVNEVKSIAKKRKILKEIRIYQRKVHREYRVGLYVGEMYNVAEETYEDDKPIYEKIFNKDNENTL